MSREKLLGLKGSRGFSATFKYIKKADPPLAGNPLASVLRGKNCCSRKVTAAENLYPPKHSKGGLPSPL